MKHARFISLLFKTCLFMPAMANTALAQIAAFTYQGRREEAGVPANGVHAFVIRLFDDISAGAQVGPTFCEDVVEVVKGLFTLEPDFGQQFTTNEERFLDIQVLDNGDCADTSEFIQLTPRQRNTATPLALHALKANVAGLAEHAGVADQAIVAFRLDAPDGSPVNAVFVDNAGKVGLGTTAPTARLDVKGDGNTSPATGTPIARFTRGNGDNFLAFFADIGGNYIIADDPSDNQKDLRLQTRNNRNILLEPHGTGKVHVRHDEPVLILQDSGPTATQSGYLGFWSSSLSETAWVGFGTPGSPHFSLFNARPGGDINLRPGAGGKVTIGPHFATAGEENLRIVRGFVNEHGVRITGSGFTAARNSEGTFTIQFAVPFTAPPIMTCTAEVIPTAAPGYVATDGVGTSSAIVRIFVPSDGALRFIDNAFSFIAIGPR